MAEQQLLWVNTWGLKAHYNCRNAPTSPTLLHWHCSFLSPLKLSAVLPVPPLPPSVSLLQMSDCKCNKSRPQLPHVQAGLGSVNLRRNAQNERNVTEWSLMFCRLELTFDSTGLSFWGGQVSNAMSNQIDNLGAASSLAHCRPAKCSLHSLVVLINPL